MRSNSLTFVCAVALLAGAAAGQSPVGTALTYQGRLTNAGSPVTGPHDVQFKLFSVAAGVGQVGSTICVDGISPNPDGTFTTTLDFGAVFTGLALWIELGVRPDATAGNCASGTYTTLAPRQRLTPAPFAMGVSLPLAQSQALNTFGAALFSITNTSTLNATYAIFGQTNATASDAAGVYGHAAGATGAVAGVKGITSSTGGYGVSGFALNSSVGASSIGVFGLSNSPDGSAMFAHANNATGSGYGVLAWAAGPSGTAVRGSAYSSTGFTVGLSGEANSPDGIGVDAYVFSSSGTPTALRARTRAPGGVAISAVHEATSGTAAAISGVTDSTSSSAVGILGTVSSSTPGSFSAAIRGTNSGSGSNGIGVWGSQNGSGYGVLGTVPSGWAVRGEATDPTAVNFGVYGETASPNGYAGYFAQNVFVGGPLTTKFTSTGPESRMTPIAYGMVDAGGALLQGTSNVTSSLVGTVYLITIAGESYQFQTYITTVTPATATTPVIATTGSGGGQLQVRLFTLAGSAATGNFHFIVYKR